MHKFIINDRVEVVSGYDKGEKGIVCGMDEWLHVKSDSGNMLCKKPRFFKLISSYNSCDECEHGDPDSRECNCYLEILKKERDNAVSELEAAKIKIMNLENNRDWYASKCQAFNNENIKLKNDNIKLKVRLGKNILEKKS